MPTLSQLVSHFSTQPRHPINFALVPIANPAGVFGMGHNMPPLPSPHAFVPTFQTPQSPMLYGFSPPASPLALTPGVPPSFNPGFPPTGPPQEPGVATAVSRTRRSASNKRQPHAHEGKAVNFDAISAPGGTRPHASAAASQTSKQQRSFRNRLSPRRRSASKKVASASLVLPGQLTYTIVCVTTPAGAVDTCHGTITLHGTPATTGNECCGLWCCNPRNTWVMSFVQRTFLQLILIVNWSFKQSPPSKWVISFPSLDILFIIVSSFSCLIAPLIFNWSQSAHVTMKSVLLKFDSTAVCSSGDRHFKTR